MPNRYLRYGDQRYIITKEAEARLNRTLDAVYSDGTRGHEWLNLYHDSAAPVPPADRGRGTDHDRDGAGTRRVTRRVVE